MTADLPGFSWHMPVQVRFGEGCSRDIPEALQGRPAVVLAFTASVRGLYAAGAPKVYNEPLQEDGYEAFWLEWAALEGAIRDRLATEGQAGIGPSEES